MNPFFTAQVLFFAIGLAMLVLLCRLVNFSCTAQGDEAVDVKPDARSLMIGAILLLFLILTPVVMVRNFITAARMRGVH